MLLNKIRRTEHIGHMLVVRSVVGVPLAATAIVHLTGWLPIRVALEAAQIPFVDLFSVLAPLTELVAAFMILFGAFARLGGAMGGVVMLAALFAHLRADWPDEPPLLIPCVIFAGCCYIVVRGAGAWSVDSRGPFNPLDEEAAGVAPAEPMDPYAKRNDFALTRDS